MGKTWLRHDTLKKQVVTGCKSEYDAYEAYQAKVWQEKSQSHLLQRKLQGKRSFKTAARKAAAAKAKHKVHRRLLYTRLIDTDLELSHV